MDEFYAPVRNLVAENFTLNFLQHIAPRAGSDSKLVEVVYTAEFVYGTPVSPPAGFSPRPNPSVQPLSGYYRVSVQQLLERVSGTTSPTTEKYPAKYLEIIISNSALDVSGSGIFTLIP